MLFGWEVILEWVAAAKQRRRDVRPRGHRGGVYPFLRATMCVIARDLIVYGVLTDMMKGRPAIYATFASYDEVAHHSGLERDDTLEALRKLDQQFGRIERARRYAARPYELVVLSDHGQTQGATFRQRNGYGLDELVQRNLAHGGVSAVAGGDEQDAMVEPRRRRGDGAQGEGGEERRLGPRRRRPRLGQPRPRLPDGEGRTDDARGARGPPSAAAAGSGLASAHRLGAREVGRARSRRARRRRRQVPRGGPCGGRRSARGLPRHGCAAPSAHARLRARAGPPRRQLLRPRPRRGLRLRGADLVPRRARRLPDAGVPALPGAAARARPTARRRRDAPPRARRVAAPARGRPRVAGRAGAGPGAPVAGSDDCVGMPGSRTAIVVPATAGSTWPACTGSADAACGSSARPSSS